MTTLIELKNRIEVLENQISCRNLEKKIKMLENEVNHIKSFLQYKNKKKNK